MNSELSPAVDGMVGALPGQPLNVPGEANLSQAGSGTWRARLMPLLLCPVKLFWAMAFCQGLIGSVIVVGWTYRLTQRSVLKYWWSKSSEPLKGESFGSFVSAQDPAKAAYRRWPNWFCVQGFREAIRRPPDTTSWHYVRSLPKTFFGSLWLNFKLGLQAVLNTAVLTLPACLFWWFGWYDGWNNSFSKGYEQAAVGPLISLFGIIWFIAAMFYVPLAQARQAATGQWRSFYQFRLVWSVVRVRWMACVGLALLYVGLALPLNIMKTAPTFWGLNLPGTLTDAEVLKRLDDYFFRCALVVLPAYVFLRWVAGRIYASGLLTLVQRGAIGRDDLAENEAEFLTRLGLLERRAERERHVLLRVVAWTGTRVSRVFGWIALTVSWFLFVGQVYVAEFFKSHGGLGWLNQPLVQLPWFHYLPARLKHPGEELFGLLLMVVVGWISWRLARRVKIQWGPKNVS
jgi:hypothetical protein